MKKLTNMVLGLLLLGSLYPSIANVSDIDWLGRITALGGAESESWKRKEGVTLGHAHAIGQLEALGVVPIFGPFGFQANLAFQGGDGWGLTGTYGPIFDFGMGKAGLFTSYQTRVLNADAASAHKNRITRFWRIIPTVSLYDIIPGTNIDIWHSNPLSTPKSTDGKEGDENKRFIPYSQTRLSVNWFPGFIPFTSRENVELTLGVQLNALAGPSHENAALGVGPVFGAAVMPWQNLEVQLFKAWMDNKNRYQVTTGVQYYFARGTPSLLQLRRKYLEPTNLPGPVSTQYKF
ncbi:MAG TPA: hypothetical protein VGA73_15575 [Candidatus Binatia bacterium]